ncbi:putative NBD/HSP70 family sugar kinase [Cellulosimicrobium cellulans J34]|nr:putative NBD/HSP70 family sugar kinase [Cellulosimicrobium cellulans J34]SMF22168.1 Sugar kinase of the NBD/HSP70 family, may contain an N-terminal HTH domain [Cellulosimicrobium cellulans J1]
MRKELAGAAAPGEPGGSRGSSARLLLQVVRDAGRATRADLAAATSLSAPAVTRAVAGLVRDGLVVELGHDATTGRGAGRPPTWLALATPDRVPDAPLVAALHLAAGTVEVALCDVAGGVVGRETLGHRPASVPERTLDVALDALGRLLATAGRGRVVAAGVAVAGVLDASGRTVLEAPNLGWSRVPVADHVGRALGLPCTVAHNVSAMALAEARRGVGVGASTVAYAHSSGGLGGGLVVDGVAYRGGAHGASELGHVVVDPAGPACRCGRRGCLETFASRPAVERLATAALGAVEGDPVAALRDAVRAGDARARAARDDLLGHLAAGFDPVVALLAPDVVVLGGALATLHDVLGEPLAAALARHAAAPPTVAPAAAGDLAGVLGAAWTALDASLYGPPPRSWPAAETSPRPGAATDPTRTSRPRRTS